MKIAKKKKVEEPQEENNLEEENQLLKSQLSNERTKAALMNEAEYRYQTLVLLSEINESIKSLKDE